jgi:predicted O-methyltransferase YrrM
MNASRRTVAALKKLVPVALKQPVRNYLDARAWRAQPRLDFDASRLRPADSIDLDAIWTSPSIAEAFAADLAAISGLMPTQEVSGGVNPGDRRAIYYLASHFKPRSVLEIGTHIGASTTFLASGLRHFGGHLTTADIVDVNAPGGPWKKLALARSPSETLSRLGLGQTVTFQARPAAEALGGSARYDLIFLDGDHTALAVYREISAALKLLNDGGLILLHDFYPGLNAITPDGSVIDGPFIASRRITEETGALAFLPLGALPWPTKSGGNRTSLALVARSG